jgi:hypothetical protein
MMLAFPLVIVGILLYIVLGMVVCLVMGAGAGLFVPLCECGVCMIFVIPFTMVLGAIVAPIYMLVILLVPSSYVFLQRYFVSIRALCRST